MDVPTRGSSSTRGRLRRGFAAGLLTAVVAASSVAGADPPATPPLTGPSVPAASTTTSPPTCVVADVTTKYAGTDDWSRTLLDWRLRVTRQYRPADLVSVSKAGLRGGGKVRAIVLTDLRAMAKAAAGAHAPIAVQSAFRSYATQRSVFAGWVSLLGRRQALKGSARAGHSEHQLGTALDFKSRGGGAPWSFGGFDWAKTKAGRWMAKNAWQYGFVMSYPRGKQRSTCYGYEPWHYRYYGRAVAAAIHASGLAPRVWLWRHGNNPGWVDPEPTPGPSDRPASSSAPGGAPEERPGA